MPHGKNMGNEHVMVESRDQESQALLQQAAAGDQAAAHRLLEMHRDRLRAMIALRLDRRLSARVDPSDVLQETMIQAHQKLPEYLRTQPIPFYPWLRRMAWENIVQLHRQHLLAQARAVTREERFDVALPDQSALDLAERLIAKGSSASRQLMQKELKARVQAALGAARCARSRSAGVAVPGAALDRRSRRGAGNLAGSRQVAAASGAGAIQRADRRNDHGRPDMNTPTATLCHSSDEVLEQLLEEITSRIQAGELVALEDYAAAHPEYADRLQRLLPAMQALLAFGRSQSATTDGLATPCGDNTPAACWATFASSARSAAAAWAWSTRPSKSRSAGRSP